MCVCAFWCSHISPAHVSHVPHSHVHQVSQHVQHFFMVYFKHDTFSEFMLDLGSNLGKVVHCSWLAASTQVSCFLVLIYL